mmetsp:Transcript_1992/g.12672  ORF Transcript_1992/g.12672 Transcript_1992/m.12672 type:complete len:222 (+) Transcript_1992:1328-1993(+)
MFPNLPLDTSVVYVFTFALAWRGHFPLPTPAEFDASPAILPRRKSRGASIHCNHVGMAHICDVASTLASWKLPLRRRPAAIVFLTDRSGFERKSLKGSCDLSSNQAFVRTRTKGTKVKREARQEQWMCPDQVPPRMAGFPCCCEVPMPQHRWMSAPANRLPPYVRWWLASPTPSTSSHRKDGRGPGWVPVGWNHLPSPTHRVPKPPCSILNSWHPWNQWCD